MYQAKTLRRMRPETRKIAKIANGLELEIRRLKRAIAAVESLEFDSRALRNGKALGAMSSKHGDGTEDLLHWPPCPECGETLRFRKGTGVFCPTEGCKFERAS